MKLAPWWGNLSTVPQVATLETTREAPPLRQVEEAQFQLDSLNEKERTLEVRWYSGAQIFRSGGFFSDPFMLEFSTDPEHVRLGRYQSGRAPLLHAHGPTFGSPRKEDVFGHVVSAEIRDGEGLGVVKFDTSPEGEAAFLKAKEGSMVNVSMGTFIYRMEKLEETVGALDVWRATDWEPFELSHLPIGADPDAHFLAADQRQPCVLVQAGPDASLGEPEKMTPEEKAAAELKAKGAGPAGQPTETPATTTNASAEEVETATAAGAKSGAQAERLRQKQIRGLVKASGLDLEVADTLIEEELSFEQAAAKVTEALEARQTEEAGGSITTQITTTREELDGVPEAVENAILHRYSPDEHKLTEHGRNYRGLALLEIGRKLVEMRGTKTAGMGKMQLAAYALGLHSTSDFPSILENVVSKILRRAYDESPVSFTSISRRTTLPDFKPTSRVQLGEAPLLEKVPESAEYSFGTLGEGKETYALATYGKIVGITRQVLVNDDLDAFTRIPQLYGNSARALQNQLAWALLTTGADGVTMGDGLALFAAGHNNTGTGAPSVPSLSEGRTTMRTQTGLSGRILNVVPRWWIVPAALETDAQKLTAPISPEAEGNVNPFVSAFQGVIAEPLLDADSALIWYLAAATGQIDVLEHAFLEGEEEVRVETMEGWKVDGVEVKASMDFAVTVLDHRGLYRSTGA